MARDADQIFTVGHSTHPLERFLALLRRHGVRIVADIRRYPGSRRHPHFDAEHLGSALAKHQIDYQPLGDSLGGRRRPRPDSLNGAWQVEGFRAYADHMSTPEFATGLRRLEDLARAVPTAFMCAEADWRRCHRRLVSDALVVRGWQVLHVLRDGSVESHALTPFAAVEGHRISYPAPQTTLET